jgi:hypothetical protein
MTIINITAGLRVTYVNDIPDGFFVGDIGDYKHKMFLKMDGIIYSLDNSQIPLGKESGNYWSAPTIRNYQPVKFLTGVL